MAAPILKLWPVYFPASIPTLQSAALKHRTSFSLDKGAPEAKVKNDPSSSPYPALPCINGTYVYAATALTGHRSHPVTFHPSASHTPFRSLSIAGVIGSRSLGRVPPVFACFSFTPCSILSRHGQDALKGSPAPHTICIHRSADRYPLIVLCFSPSSTSETTNWQSWFSDRGRGRPPILMLKVRYLRWPDS